MKSNYSKSEQGQGCIEIIVGLVIIVVIIMAIVGALTELAARIKKNIVDIQSTPLISVTDVGDISDIKTPETFELEGTASIPEPFATIETPNSVVTIVPIVETALPNATQIAQPETPNLPKKTFWQKILDWLNK